MQKIQPCTNFDNVINLPLYVTVGMKLSLKTTFISMSALQSTFAMTKVSEVERRSTQGVASFVAAASSSGKARNATRIGTGGVGLWS